MVYHLLSDGLDADGLEVLEDRLMMPITSEGQARYKATMANLSGVLNG